MNYGKNKILPLFKNKNKKKCCICYENKQNCIKCSNAKCVDGVICLTCLKKMSITQKEKCPLCRTKLVILIKNDKKKKKNKIIKKFCCIIEKIKILLIAILSILCSYIIGIILFVLIDIKNISQGKTNPVVLTIIGSIILSIIFFCYVSSVKYIKLRQDLLTN